MKAEPNTTEYDAFKALLNKLVSVPKEEILRREAEYRAKGGPEPEEARTETKEDCLAYAASDFRFSTAKRISTSLGFARANTIRENEANILHPISDSEATRLAIWRLLVSI